MYLAVTDAWESCVIGPSNRGWSQSFKLSSAAFDEYALRLLRHDGALLICYRPASPANHKTPQLLPSLPQVLALACLSTCGRDQQDTLSLSIVHRNKAYAIAHPRHSDMNAIVLLHIGSHARNLERRG